MQNDRSIGRRASVGGVGLVSIAALVLAVGIQISAGASDSGRNPYSACLVPVSKVSSEIGYSGSGIFESEIDDPAIYGQTMKNTYPKPEDRYNAYGRAMYRETRQLATIESAVSRSQACFEKAWMQLQSDADSGRLDKGQANIRLDHLRAGVVQAGDFLYDNMDRADKQLQVFNVALNSDEDLSGALFDDLMDAAGEAYLGYCGSESREFACSRTFLFRDEEGQIVSETDLVFLTELAGFAGSAGMVDGEQIDAAGLNAMVTAAGPEPEGNTSRKGYMSAGLASSRLLDAYVVTADLSNAQRMLEHKLTETNFD